MLVADADGLKLHKEMTPKDARDWIELLGSLDFSKAVLFIFIVVVAVMVYMEKKSKRKPLTAIATGIGKAINKEVIDELSGLKLRMDSIDGQLSALEDRMAESEKEDKERNAKQARVRLLRFNGELIRKKRHTSEEFKNVIKDVDEYEEYCDANPDFKNNEAKLSIENIKKQYQRCQEQGDFLPEEMM